MFYDNDNEKAAIAAWAAFKASITMPKKNNRNTHFKNSYADLGQVLAAIMPVAQEHGFLIQQSVWHNDGHPYLETTVRHLPTGYYVATTSYPLAQDKPGPQPLGSCVTYARRYALKTLFDMVDVDDDGVGAHGQIPQSDELDTVLHLIGKSETADDLMSLKPMIEKLPKAAKVRAQSVARAKFVKVTSNG